LVAPTNNERVEHGESVQGRSGKLESGQSLWVLVYSQKVGRYYPQNAQVSPDANGNWSTMAYFGTETAGVNEKFDLVVVVADASANSQFTQYMNQAKASGDYSGMVSLPAGAQEKQRITVTRI
jgi:hypothetical protein